MRRQTFDTWSVVKFKYIDIMGTFRLCQMLPVHAIKFHLSKTFLAYLVQLKDNYQNSFKNYLIKALQALQICALLLLSFHLNFYGNEKYSQHNIIYRNTTAKAVYVIALRWVFLALLVTVQSHLFTLGVQQLSL